MLKSEMNAREMRALFDAITIACKSQMLRSGDREALRLFKRRIEQINGDVHGIEMVALESKRMEHCRWNNVPESLKPQIIKGKEY